MKKRNKFLSLLCVSAMLAGLLALSACGDGGSGESTSPSPSDSTSPSESETVTPSENQEPAGEAKLTDGYYKTDISGLACFVRFNEDGTYFASYFGGGVTEAGTYEVADKSADYYETYNDGVADEASKKTAAQVITLTSYVGGGVTEIPFDGDKLCDFVAGGMSSHVFMEHDAAFAYSADDMENPPIAVQTLYANNDAGMTLTLYHNRSFVDYTGDKRVSGTWEPTADGYELTTDDGAKYTLTMTDGGVTYDKAGESVELADKVTAGAVVAEFAPEADVPVSGVPGMDGPTDCPVKLVVYDNDTMELIVDTFGNEIIVDKGTWTVDTSGPIPAYTFTFESAGELVTEPDYASATESSIVLNLNYAVTDAACSVEVAGNVMEQSLSLETALSYTYEMGD